MKKLKLDSEKYDLVIASLSKGKIFEIYADIVEA
jgi:hypothetical protein